MKKILTTIIAVIALVVTTFAQPGSLDTTFDPGTGASNAVYTNSIQNDGNIIIGGQFTSYNGIAINRIARLNTDGTLDDTFDPGTGVNGSVIITSIQSDGKIIVGGSFSTYNEIAINRLARLNTDGSLDDTFDSGTGANNAVFTTSIQSDGKIIIGGFFTSYNGIATNRIARLNTDGTLDETFDSGTGANNNVYTTSIQSDGKILIGGPFESYNGIAISGIARLNTDGTLDENFTPGTGTDNEVLTTSIQNDGKIIIGGQFTSYNGIAINRIARLNTDGTLDDSFNPGTGASGFIQTTSIQNDGNIIIGGGFTSYNDTERSYIARVLGGTTMGLSSISNSTNIMVYPNPFSVQTTLQSDHFLKNATITVYNLQGQVVKEIKNISGQTVTLFRDNLSSGLYFMQMTEENKIITAAKLVITDTKG